MACPYTGCYYNSPAQHCKRGLTPDKCAFGIQEKRVEVAYEKGIKYGREAIAKRILKIMFPSFGKDIGDAIIEGVEKGQSNQEILDRIDQIRNAK